MYGYLIPRWLDGMTISYGGLGTQTITGWPLTAVQFMFTGDPPDFWSDG